MQFIKIHWRKGNLKTMNSNLLEAITEAKINVKTNNKNNTL